MYFRKGDTVKVVEEAFEVGEVEKKQLVGTEYNVGGEVEKCKEIVYQKDIFAVLCPFCGERASNETDIPIDLKCKCGAYWYNFFENSCAT